MSHTYIVIQKKVILTIGGQDLLASLSRNHMHTFQATIITCFDGCNIPVIRRELHSSLPQLMLPYPQLKTTTEMPDEDKERSARLKVLLKKICKDIFYTIPFHHSIPDSPLPLLSSGHPCAFLITEAVTRSCSENHTSHIVTCFL